MADLLVKLYNLQAPKRPLPDGTTVRRAFAAEKRLVAQWVAKHFGERWASECEISFMREPVACFVATNELDVFGFATYDATARGFCGPTGTDEKARHKGGRQSANYSYAADMASQGYAYGIIGATTSIDFYRNEVAAIEIPESTLGFYRGMLKPSRP